MSESKRQPDLEMDSLSRMARESADFFAGLATTLDVHKKQPPPRKRRRVQAQRKEMPRTPEPHNLADLLRGHAADCLRQAELEKLPETRDGLRSVAVSYLKLASTIEK